MMNASRWDKRSWLLAFGGGNLCGALAAFAGFPPIEKTLNTIFSLVVHGNTFTDIVSIVFALIGLLILPIYLTATARRVPFFFGLMPVVLVCIWVMGEDCIQNKRSITPDDIYVALFMLAANIVLTCGPISFYRLTQRRKAQRIAAQYQAMRDAQLPQEGVWPPPPQHSTNLTE